MLTSERGDERARKENRWRLHHVVGVDLLGSMDVHATNTWEQSDLVHPAPGKATLTENGYLKVRVPAPGLAVVRVSVT
jgi:hypothetical protein